jgi:hypothetical protein
MAVWTEVEIRSGKGKISGLLEAGARRVKWSI